MSAQKRYLIGSRLGPQLAPQTQQELEAFVAARPDVTVIKRTPVGRYVIEATEEARRELAAKFPHLVIEEDQELDMFPMPGLPEVISAGETFARHIVVKDALSGQALPHVTLYGIGDGPAYKAVTDAAGEATLWTNEAALRRLIVSPRDTHWSRVVENVSLREAQTLEVALRPLLMTGAYTWGHRLMGFDAVRQRWRGRGVRIGVIDSGVSSAAEDLSPAGGHNTLDDEDPAAWNVDEKGHGTHCAGILAARDNAVGVLGGAPAAEVYALKVFPGGRLSDLVEAVEWCIRQRIEVINLSLGSPQSSRVLSDVLRDAYERGITCVAAAGNDRTHVAYPAALPTVLAVSALGRFGTFPEDSAHALKIGPQVDWRGQLFAAEFTNFGLEVDVCAPGVALLSTVPTGYACWDGTSFACPLVSALVALILEASPRRRTGDARQPEFVRALLYHAAIRLGLPPLIEGYGLPLATRALAAAAAYAAPPRRYYGF